VVPFPGGAKLDFIEWIQLVFGGDDTGAYNEDDSSPPGVSTPSMVGSTPPDFMVNQNASMLLLAAYISEPPTKVDWKWILQQLVPQTFPGPNILADPGPEDWIRRHGNEAILETARSLVITGGDLFAHLGEHGRNLSAAQRREAIAQIKSAIRRGEATLHTLELSNDKLETHG
jgi:hypothetical protein